MHTAEDKKQDIYNIYIQPAPCWGRGWLNKLWSIYIQKDYEAIKTNKSKKKKKTPIKLSFSIAMESLPGYNVQWY